MTKAKMPSELEKKIAAIRKEAAEKVSKLKKIATEQEAKEARRKAEFDSLIVEALAKWLQAEQANQQERVFDSACLGLAPAKILLLRERWSELGLIASPVPPTAPPA